MRKNSSWQRRERASRNPCQTVARALAGTRQERIARAVGKAGNGQASLTRSLDIAILARSTRQKLNS